MADLLVGNELRSGEGNRNVYRLGDLERATLRIQSFMPYEQPVSKCKEFPQFLQALILAACSSSGAVVEVLQLCAILLCESINCDWTNETPKGFLSYPGIRNGNYNSCY